jgi:hypothetical protein
VRAALTNALNVRIAVLFIPPLGGTIHPVKSGEWRAMSDDLESCRKMRLMYLQRAKSDPLQTGKWLERAERWAEHARREEAWLSYQRSARQQMNAGAMGPSGEVSSQQQG